MAEKQFERWENRVAFVTGGNSGIGAAVVRRLIDIGVTVVGFDINIDHLQVLSINPGTSKCNVHAIKGDVRKEEDVVAAFQWVEDNLGGVHILVNNAGVVAHDTFTIGDVEKWKQVLETNVLGLAICTREAVNSMHAHGFDEGHIFNINSISGHSVDSFFAPMYVASKFAVTALTEALRKELLAKDSNIRVTSICPGMVQTGILASIPLPDSIRKNALVPDDIADLIIYILSLRQSVHINSKLVGMKRSEDIKQTLGIFNLNEPIKQCNCNWQEHFDRME